jgi:hypothetical protein
MPTSFESYLNNVSESDWLSTIDILAPAIHSVDRSATQIWFRFYPLDFRRFIEKGSDESELRRSLGLLGDYDLANQIDTSHRFLYGHRFWKVVKAAIEAEAEVFTDQKPQLADEIIQVAGNIAEKLKVDVSLVIGITAVGFMTLNHVGLEKFKAAAG